MMIIKTDYIPLHHANRPGVKLEAMKARVWHATSNRSPSAGAVMHRKYVGRSYRIIGGRKYESDGRTPFVVGCAHVYIDTEAAIIMIPLDEYAPAAGDRHLPYGNGFKGQTKLASEMFVNRQNWQTIQIELCMNDMTKWPQVLQNGIEFAKQYCPDVKLLDLQHYELTHKPCPEPFMGKDSEWSRFKEDLSLALSLSILQSKGIIAIPDYWMQNAVKGKTVIGEYAGKLIGNMAEKLY